MGRRRPLAWHEEKHRAHPEYAGQCGEEEVAGPPTPGGDHRLVQRQDEGDDEGAQGEPDAEGAAAVAVERLGQGAGEDDGAGPGAERVDSDKTEIVVGDRRGEIGQADVAAGQRR